MARRLPKRDKRGRFVARSRRLPKRDKRGRFVARSRRLPKRDKRPRLKREDVRAASGFRNVTTWFKAQGVVNYALFAKRFSEGPLKFVSYERLLLSRVKFSGEYSAEDLIGLLNRRLNYTDLKGRGPYDFREVCESWRYKWQLVGFNPRTKKTERIVGFSRAGGGRIKARFFRSIGREQRE